MAEVTGLTRFALDELVMEPTSASDLTWPVREYGTRHDVWLAARDLGDALLIRLGEFGAPAVRVRLGDGEQRRRWGARVGGEAA